MISGSARWYTVGGHLVTAVKDGLTESVARYGQVPGEIAWDECCAGLLAVSAPRVYLSEIFPEETEVSVSPQCRAPFEVGEFTVSVLRCAPNPDGDGNPPSAAALDAAAALLLQDMAEAMDAVIAVLCALQDADSISDYLADPVEAAGPEGSCMGFTLKVRVGLERP